MTLITWEKASKSGVSKHLEGTAGVCWGGGRKSLTWEREEVILTTICPSPVGNYEKWNKQTGNRRDPPSKSFWSNGNHNATFGDFFGSSLFQYLIDKPQSKNVMNDFREKNTFLLSFILILTHIYDHVSLTTSNNDQNLKRILVEIIKRT